MSLPTEDKSYMTKKDMENEIKTLLGGRVSEALTLDDISTGASNDIQRATDIARSMVTQYGFSEKVGPVNYSDDGDVFLGRDFSKTKAYSESIASDIDHEVISIINAAYKETEEILKNHMEQLERVAQALLLVETIDGDQFEELFTGTIDAEGLEAKIKEEEEKIRKINEEEAEENKRIREQEQAMMPDHEDEISTDYMRLDLPDRKV